MSSDRLRQHLYDIRDNIVHARGFVGSMTAKQFAHDLKSFYAAVRALEIMSEAPRHLPPELKARHAGLDWVAIRDAGNVYRHGYESVTEQRVWDTVVTQLAPLLDVVERELALLGA